MSSVSGLINMESEITGDRVGKRILIHDLGKFFSESLFDKLSYFVYIVSANPPVAPCRGCFSCWIKTPGQCIIEDDAQWLQGVLRECKELTIVSRMIYGGFSPEIKAYIDRLIPSLLPFFKVKNGRMRHPYRYDNKLKINFIFYSDFAREEFSLHGLEDRILQELAVEVKSQKEKEEADMENKVRIVQSSDPDHSSEKIDEIIIAERLAKAVSVNLELEDYEFHYARDIFSIKEVLY